MKNLYLFIVMLGYSLCSTQKVDDSIIPRTVIGPNANYKDFVVNRNKLYGLTLGDSLMVWDTKREKVIVVKTRVTSIAKGKNDRIFYTTSNGEIGQASNDRHWKIKGVFDSDAKVYNTVIDERNRPAILTDRGIFYKDSLYVPPIDTPFYRKAGRVGSAGYIIKPDVVFLDREQRIWMGYDAGEWGGDGCFFDLKTKEFYCDEGLEIKYIKKFDPEFEKNLNPSFSDILKEFPEEIKITTKDTLYRFPNGFTLANSKGIAQDENGNFYISNSLMHFFVDGAICIVSGKDGVFYKTIDNKTILKHSTSEGFTEGTTMINIEEYLGPVTFNPFDKFVYYYTNEGFFRMFEKNGNYDKEFIFRPYITWTAGLPDAVGYQMNVSKFEFVSKNDFLFLTGKNGIGYFKGNEVVYFR